MDILLVDKIAIVTGAARGIGFSIARLFAASGAIVIIADIDDSAGQIAADSITDQGYKCEYKKLDLSKPAGFDDFVSDIYETHKRIDILVNNARAGGKFGLMNENAENWFLTTNVILMSSFFLSQSVIKIMAKANSGVILNISSVAGILATPESPSYHAAKGGLISLTKYLAIEAGAYGVRVNALLPGLIIQDQHSQRFESEGNRAYRRIAQTYQPGTKVGTERDVAEATLFFCSEQSKYISGASLLIDGGATAQEQFGLSFKISNLFKDEL